MGVLRVILALSVLLSHVGGILISSGGRIALYFGTGGEVAVQCFYILSGFYMALILDGKYGRTAEGTLLFYTNRLFRLMPLYLLFLCVSFCLSYLATVSYSFPKQPATDLILHHDRLGIGALAYVALSNLFVFGHDLVIFFLGIDPADGSLFFTTRLPETPRLAIELFFIPQSWTLSLEFSFYLLAPFLVGRTRLSAVLVVASLCLRALLYSIGYGPGYHYNFWAYAFFPNELALFLLGTLSYKLYTRMKGSTILNKTTTAAASALVLALTLGFPLLPRTNTIPFFFNDAQLVYYTAVVLCLPFLFALTKDSTTDRVIGELSYPVYLSHLMIIPFFGVLYRPGQPVTTVAAVVFATLMVSLLAIFVVQVPVDRYRGRRLANSKAVP